MFSCTQLKRQQSHEAELETTREGGSISDDLTTHFAASSGEGCSHSSGPPTHWRRSIPAARLTLLCGAELPVLSRTI